MNQSTRPSTPPENSSLAGDAGQGQPSPSQMMKALQKSGYIFEHEIAVALEQMGYHTERSFAYEDVDEGKSRELDIRGFKSVRRNSTYKLDLSVHFFIECKDSASPLVFLQTEKNQSDRERPEAREYLFPVSLSDGGSPFRMRAHNLSFDHYYYVEKKKSVQFAKIIRKNGEFSALHDNVYDSLLLPQAKAFLSFLPSGRHVYSRSYGHERIDLAFNVIVLRDHLFVLDLDQPGAEPVPAGRASFVRQIESKAISGKYLFDFVTQRYFKEYVQQEVEPFVRAVEKAMMEKPSLFRAHGRAETPPDPTRSHKGTPWG